MDVFDMKLPPIPKQIRKHMHMLTEDVRVREIHDKLALYSPLYIIIETGSTQSAYEALSFPSHHCLILCDRVSSKSLLA